MPLTRPQIRVLMVLLLSGLASGSLAAQSVQVLGIDLEAFTLSGDTLVGIRPDSGIVTAPAPYESFTQRRAAPSEPLESFTDLAARDGTVAVAGADGLILRSADGGVSWTRAETPAAFGDLLGIAPGAAAGGATVWVAVGDNGLDGVVFASSDDGRNWVKSAAIADVFLKDVVWTGTRWVACGFRFLNQGVVTTSTDGVSWSAVTLPADTPPLLALGQDGNGGVVAVGEQGAVLHSTNHGAAFTRLANPFFSGDLRVVYSGSAGKFLLGGDERVVLEVDAGALGERFPPGPGAPAIEGLAEAGGVLFLGGKFSGLQTVPVTLTLRATVLSGSELKLTLLNSDPSRFYHLEESSNLQAWTPVPGTTRGGTGSEIDWTVPVDEPKYWRAVAP